MADYTHIIPDQRIVLENDTRSRDVLLLQIDDDGAVRLHTRTYYGGDAVPASEWHGVDISIALTQGDGIVDSDRLRDDLAEGGWLSSRIDRIIEGHSTKWNGNNTVGVTTEDADEASEDIELRVDRDNPFIDDTWAVQSASEFLWVKRRESLDVLNVTTDASDTDIATAAELAEAIAEDQHVILTGSVEDAIREIIATVRENEDA